MATVSLLTEVDLLKMLVLKSSEPKPSLKLYLMIWVAITKFLKAQCDKGRLVDSKILGHFFKGKTYKFVPSPELLEKTVPKLSSDLEILPPRRVSSQSQISIGSLGLCESPVPGAGLRVFAFPSRGCD